MPGNSQVIRILAVWAMLISIPALSQTDVRQFDDAEQKALYQKVTKELRCLVCQNQNLADSNAELARDLRQKSYDMIRQGKGYDEIVNYMVDRYGDFVIYRPPLKTSTILLWFAPFILLVAGIVFAVSRIRRRAAGNESPFSDRDLDEARKLMDDEHRT